MILLPPEKKSYIFPFCKKNNQKIDLTKKTQFEGLRLQSYPPPHIVEKMKLEQLYLFFNFESHQTHE